MKPFYPVVFGGGSLGYGLGVLTHHLQSYTGNPAPKTIVPSIKPPGTAPTSS